MWYLHMINTSTCKQRLDLCGGYTGDYRTILSTFSAYLNFTMKRWGNGFKRRNNELKYIVLLCILN